MKNKVIVKRTIILTAIVALLLLCIIVLVGKPDQNELIPCYIAKTTGLHCPSCGGTRWAYYLMRLNIKKAFYYHAYLTIISPLIIYALTAIAVNEFMNKIIIPYPKHPLATYIICLMGLVIFTIFRNLTSIIY